MNNMIIEGVVLEKNHYRDTDAMVTILTERGLVSFLARGAFKKDSKNSFSLSTYTLGQYDLIEMNENKYILKTGVCKKTFINIFNSFEALSLLLTMSECTIKALNEFDEGDIYFTLKNVIYYMNNNGNPTNGCLFYLLQLLKFTGYRFDFQYIPMTTEEHQLIEDYLNFNYCDSIPDYKNSILNSCLKKTISYFEYALQTTIKTYDDLKNSIHNQ